MKTILTVLAISFPLWGVAQPDLSQQEVKELKALKKELKGTYQIQMIGTRKKPAVMLSLYDTIASKRKQEEVAYHRVSDHMRIKILPRKRIEAPDFKGVRKRIVHIEESAVE